MTTPGPDQITPDPDQRDAGQEPSPQSEPVPMAEVAPAPPPEPPAPEPAAADQPTSDQPTSDQPAFAASTQQPVTTRHEGEHPISADASSDRSSDPAFAAGASAAVAALLVGRTETEQVDQPESPEPEGHLKALRSKVADRSAAAMMLSVAPVAGIVGFSLVLTLTTAWMRGSAATGFELIGRGRNYEDAWALGWPVMLATLPALLDGLVAALLGAQILSWVESVPVARRGWRWAAAFLPLLITMPVRAAGPTYFLGPDRPLAENSLTSGVMTNVIWISAAIPMAVLVVGVATRWVKRHAAVLLAAALCSSWLALDIAAPGLAARFVPISTLGPVIDTLMSLSGQLQLSAALVVMAVGTLAVLLGAAGWYAMRFGRPAEPAGAARPLTAAGSALAIGSLAVTYLPILVTLLVGLWAGARPWRLCAPPSGCSPLLTTAVLLVPTALAAGFLAAAAYYAGWLNPIYRRPSTVIGMVCGFILPPTALGVALWLTAVFLHVPRGLFTLFVGQVLVATGLAYCAVQMAHQHDPYFDIEQDGSYAVPGKLRRSALYAGALGALYASSDFALANQLSGAYITVPTSAYAEAVTLGSVGDEVLASLMWSILITPVFLYFLAQLLKLAAPPDAPPDAGSQAAPREAAEAVSPT